MQNAKYRFLHLTLVGI